MTTNQPSRHPIAASLSLAAILFAPLLFCLCAGGLNAAAASNSKTTPSIHWSTPGAVRYGTPLNSYILQAWVSGALPGTFVYTPAAGTVLGAGTHTLSVTFNPTDTTDYASASTTVQLTVEKAVLLVAAFNVNPASYGTYGDPIPPLRYSINNFVNGDTLSSAVSGTPVITTTAVRNSPVGQYPITPTLGTLSAANYTFAFQAGMLYITPTTLWVSAYSYSEGYGDQLPTFKYSIEGFKNSDTKSSLGGAPSMTTTAVQGSAPGNYPITPAIGTMSNSNYRFQLVGGTLTIVKARSVITWPTPAAVTYGTTLGATQLNARAYVPGTFVYTPASGSVLGAGSQTLSVTFTPTNTTDFATAAATVQLTVNKATPAITWPTPAAITVGTALSGTQLDATANVAGSFVYTPAAGTVPALGTDTLSVAFTPTDTSDYTTAAATVPLTVGKMTPTINWPTPAAVIFGTALSSTQLDATANLPGTFAYTPAAGVVLSAGTNTLSVTFSPADSTDYTSVTSTVQLTVNRATPAISLKSSAGAAALGGPVTFTATVTGVSGGVAPTGAVSFVYGFTGSYQVLLCQGAVNDGVATCTVDMPVAGSLSITAVTFPDQNYLSIRSTALIATVTKGTPTISLKSSATQSHLGATVVFTATLTGVMTPYGMVTPAGAVTFFDGKTKLGTGTVDDVGVASFSTPKLGLGTHSITVTFPGDSNYTAATSMALTETISPISATTTVLDVTSAGSPVTTVDSGSVVTLTATVEAGSTPVTQGTVNFCDAAATYCTDIHLLGTAQLTMDGTATFKLRPGVGDHSYKAVFAGTAAHTASTSKTAALEVTGLRRSATAIAQSGSAGSYILTATAGGNGSAAPTGTVSFLDTSNGNAVLATKTLGAGTAGLNFVNSSTPAIPGTPENVAIADFNGDGIPDMAIGNLATGDVTVFLGNGDGTLKATSSLAAGANFDIIATGDFTGNGIQDLEITTYDGDLGIFLGNGDGTFAPVSWPVNVQHLGVVALGDFNRDGMLDIAVSNYNGCCAGQGVNILLGNGDGTFTVAPVAAPSSEVLDMVEGDFNGDGIQDLAVTNFGYDTVEIWLGNGDGTFTQKSSITPGVWAFGQSLAVADFNGDGNLDVAVVDPYNYTVTILLGDGTGDLTQLPSSPKTGAHPNSITVGDFNGDGIADLAVLDGIADGKNGELTILLGNGDGTFTPTGVSPPIGVTTENVWDYGTHNATADFNGDGVSDLVAVNALIDPSEGSLSVLLAVNQTATATAAGVSVQGTGTHQVVVSYSGDSNYKPSVSQPIALTAGSSASPAGAHPQR